MRKFIIAALIGSTVAAAPAAAQYGGRGGGYGYGQGVEQQLGQITQRVQRLRERRQITPQEAQRLFRQADGIDRLQDRYARDGLSRWEREDLLRRVQALRSQVRWERNDRYDRDDDRYDRDDRRDRRDRDD